MNRRLMMAVWALSGLTSLVFAGYWAWYAVRLAGASGTSPGGSGGADGVGGTGTGTGTADLAGAPAVVGVATAVVVVGLVVVVLLAALGQVRLNRLRRRFPESTIVRARAVGGLDAFADRYWLDTGRPLPTFSGPLYASFSPRVLTLLSRDGAEVVSFDTTYARLDVEERGGFAGGDAAVAVAIEGYPRLVLAFPRAWSLGALQLSPAAVSDLVARTR
ncbi:hypothetical protein NVV95_02740 [Herbiconiux sp. CPCC 205716]|uniref:DUF2550 family protein n=1 Tax=Herbiconiux gentiana TaxID=2970912 RepID=A0ABT2GB82_9MICO|nr:hypothetical protein [Herbiconiux gentiana]MCS5713467.1 hypothetical protein [Herbiconiux gentiana]